MRRAGYLIAATIVTSALSVGVAQAGHPLVAHFALQGQGRSAAGDAVVAPQAGRAEVVSTYSCTVELSGLDFFFLPPAEFDFGADYSCTRADGGPRPAGFSGAVTGTARSSEGVSTYTWAITASGRFEPGDRPIDCGGTFTLLTILFGGKYTIDATCTVR